MQRPFASGSRQAPDPFDQFLEEHGFYRKHTARDASCLFRSISEQLYDSQNYHMHVRKRCVEYMRKHKEYFQPAITREIDEYLDDMSKPKTFGTLLELQAISFLYLRNILLFEAYNRGTWLSHQFYYTDVFRVFYTPEKHFDSVFTNTYIEDAAFCQSIVYDMLYKNVFKLPDITFAVEQMLHSSSFENINYYEEIDDEGYCTKLVLEDGRSFSFDLPNTTNCILDDFQLCHFHNPNFSGFAEEFQRKVALQKNVEERRFNRITDSFLPEKFLSCVRQLLQEGITPFPYKVAKALDPDMYRNIEFDSWNEARKELKLKNWYQGGSNFQVGVKCNVKLRTSQPDLLTCHIQEMTAEKGPCTVFIEELGENRCVPYDSLKPLPGDQSKAWALPIRLQRHIERYNAYRMRNNRFSNYKSRASDEYLKNHIGYCVSSSPSNCYNGCENDEKKDNVLFRLKKYTHMENFRTETFEFCTMPMTVERDRNLSKKSPLNNKGDKKKEDENDSYEQDNLDEHDNELDSSPEQHSNQGGYVDPLYAHPCDSNLNSAPTSLMTAASSCYYACNPGYNQSYFPAPPTYIFAGNSASNLMPPVHQVPGNYQHGESRNYCEPVRSTSPVRSLINYNAKKSVQACGSDLPTDANTLRFFFNLGLEYYHKNKEKFDSASGKDGVVKFSKLMHHMQLNENYSNTELDSNNNSTNSKSYACPGQHQIDHHQKKPQSKNYGRKDRPTHKGAATRYSVINNTSTEQGKPHRQIAQNVGSNKNSNSGYDGRNSRGNTPTSTPSTSLVLSEQGIQTSPMVFTEAIVSNQNPPTVCSTPTQLGQYVSMYPTESGEYTHHPTNVYFPLPQSSYGMLSVPPPMSATLSGQPSSGYPTYLASHASVPINTGPYHSIHPPTMPNQMPSLPPPTYISQSADPNGIPYITGDCFDSNQYPYISYAPSIPVYYSSTNNLGGPPPPTGQPQGYWCVPPPQPQAGAPSGGSQIEQLTPTSGNGQGNNCSSASN